MQTFSSAPRLVQKQMENTGNTLFPGIRMNPDEVRAFERVVRAMTVSSFARPLSDKSLVEAWLCLDEIREHTSELKDPSEARVAAKMARLQSAHDVQRTPMATMISSMTRENLWEAMLLACAARKPSPTSVHLALTQGAPSYLSELIANTSIYDAAYLVLPIAQASEVKRAISHVSDAAVLLNPSKDVFKVASAIRSVASPVAIWNSEMQDATHLHTLSPRSCSLVKCSATSGCLYLSFQNHSELVAAAGGALVPGSRPVVVVSTPTTPWWNRRGRATNDHLSALRDIRRRIKTHGKEALDNFCDVKTVCDLLFQTGKDSSKKATRVIMGEHAIGLLISYVCERPTLPYEGTPRLHEDAKVFMESNDVTSNALTLYDCLTRWSDVGTRLQNIMTELKPYAKEEAKECAAEAKIIRRDMLLAEDAQDAEKIAKCASDLGACRVEMLHHQGRRVGALFKRFGVDPDDAHTENPSLQLTTADARFLCLLITAIDVHCKEASDTFQKYNKGWMAFVECLHSKKSSLELSAMLPSEHACYFNKIAKWHSEMRALGWFENFQAASEDFIVDNYVAFSTVKGGIKARRLFIKETVNSEERKKAHRLFELLQSMTSVKTCTALHDWTHYYRTLKAIVYRSIGTIIDIDGGECRKRKLDAVI